MTIKNAAVAKVHLKHNYMGMSQARKLNYFTVFEAVIHHCWHLKLTSAAAAFSAFLYENKTEKWCLCSDKLHKNVAN